MHKAFFIVCAFCCSLLTACSSLPDGRTGDSSADSAESALSSDESRLVLQVIAFAQRASSTSTDEQRKEISAAAKAFTRERSTASRLHYGVLLALPAYAGADAQRALTLLEPLATTGTTGPVRQLASLLILQISERMKEQRRAQQFKEQLDESRTSERVLNERASQLKIQLDELRAIERTLIKRGRPK